MQASTYFRECLNGNDIRYIIISIIEFLIGELYIDLDFQQI